MDLMCMCAIPGLELIANAGGKVHILRLFVKTARYTAALRSSVAPLQPLWVNLLTLQWPLSNIGNTAALWNC